MERHLLHAGHHDDADVAAGIESEESWITSMAPMRIHAICMAVGWLFCINVGGMVARYLKSGAHNFPQWFPIHIWLQGGGAVLCLIGFFTIFGHIASEDGPHFNGLHQLMGFLIVLSVIFQVYLGFAAHYSWYEGKATSPIDMWHWWIGRGTLVAAMFECLLGVQIFSEEGLKVGANVWGSVAGALFFSFLLLAAYEIYYKSGTFSARPWKGDLTDDSPSSEFRLTEMRFVLLYAIVIGCCVTVAVFGIVFNVEMAN